MLTENDAVDLSLLRTLVEQRFGEQAGELTFQPIGEDSWSYLLGRLWVSVRRDVQGHTPAAYEAAFRLHRDGLKSVLAPLSGSDGAVVQNLRGLPVVVFPYVEATQITPRQPLTIAESAELGRILSVLHGSPQPPGLPVEDFELPFHGELTRSLAAARRRGSPVGPFSERFRDLVATHTGHLERLRAERDDIASLLRRRDLTFVVTHGDLNSGNVLRTRDGLKLADWGLARWAPPERDWYHLNRTLGLALHGDAELLRYYDLRWQLSEIAEYATVFTRPHDHSDDHQAMWRRLLQYLPESSGCGS